MAEIEAPERREEEFAAVGELSDDTLELKGKAVTSFGWATLQQVFGRILSFSVNLALARLLVPEDFGTVAALGIFSAIATQLADLGFGSSLTRSERVDDADLSTVFYYNVGMSVLMYGICFLLAPLASLYFRNPVLTDVVRVQLLGLVISSLGGVHAILLWRTMEFRKDFYLQMLGNVLSAAVGIGMAYYGMKYWALVGMTLTAGVVRLCVLWFFVDWRPKWLFRLDRLRVHFAFGVRMVAAGLVGTIYNNLSTILVGRYFDLRTLGLYNNAWALQQVPVSALADPINKVSYPVFVRIQGDRERLKAGYRRVMRLLFQISCPIMVSLVVLANPLYHFFYTDKWMEAAPYFQILCICGILFPINSYNINLLEVLGRSDLHLRLEVVRRAIGVVGLVVGLYFGIYGLLWSSVVVQVVYLFVNSYYSGRLIQFGLWEQLRGLFPFALMSAVAGLVVWAVDHYFLSGLGDFPRLALGATLMGLSYLALAWIFTREEVVYLWGLVRQYLLRGVSLGKLSRSLTRGR